MLIEWLIRLAAFCFGFFALGHTLGHIARHKIKDPQAQQVLTAMQSYRYNLFGKMRTYDENYIGMSLNLIATLVFLAVVLFYSSFYLASSLDLVKGFVFISLFVSTIFSITSFRYFFVVPGATCLVASICLFSAWILMP